MHQHIKSVEFGKRNSQFEESPLLIFHALAQFAEVDLSLSLASQPFPFSSMNTFAFS